MRALDLAVRAWLVGKGTMGIVADAVADVSTRAAHTMGEKGKDAGKCVGDRVDKLLTSAEKALAAKRESKQVVEDHQDGTD